VWPTKNAPRSHGLCGDPVQGKSPPADWRDETYLVPNPVQRSYTAGDVVEFHVGVSTHHQGHYEFRICDKALSRDVFQTRAEGQACLDSWVLERAQPRADCKPDDPDADCQILDPDQPHRWFLPPTGANTQEAGPNWDDRMASPHYSESEVHRMRYKIPLDLNCTHCTLQWYWSTGNTCLYDSGYFSYFSKMAAAGWSASNWCASCMSGSDCTGKCCGAPSGKFAEEFWNCADIRVLAVAQGQQPEVGLPPRETTRVPQAGTSPPPAPMPTLAPSAPMVPTHAPQLSETCVEAWGQCGGGSHAGPTCCVSGHFCKKIDALWYHQCVPDSFSEPSAQAEPEGESEEEEEEEEEAEDGSSVTPEDLSLGALQTRPGSHSARPVRKHSFLASALLQTNTCLRSETSLDEDVVDFAEV